VCLVQVVRRLVVVPPATAPVLEGRERRIGPGRALLRVRLLERVEEPKRRERKEGFAVLGRVVRVVWVVCRCVPLELFQSTLKSPMIAISLADVVALAGGMLEYC